MKQLSLVKVSLGLILITLFTGVLKSCTSKNDFIPRQDTVQVIARQQQGNVVFMDSAIMNIQKIKKFKDEDALEATWSIDTTYRLLQMVDTLRDSLKHAIFDSKHNAKFKFVYSPTPMSDTFDKYIRVVDIPNWKK
jgi:hypothetical protein